MGSIWKVVVMYKQALFLVSLVFLSTFVRSQPVKVAESPKEAAPAKEKAAAGETPAEEEPPAEEPPAEEDPPAEEPVADETAGAAASDVAGGAHPAEDKIDEAIQVMNKLNDLFETIVNSLGSAGGSDGAPAVDGEASDAGVAKEGSKGWSRP